MAPSPLTADDQLIPLLISGDRAAYTAIVRAYHSGMVQLARSIVGDGIAEEVVQESWLAVMRNLARFEGRSSLKTWILRIVSNTALTRLRHEKRSISLEDLQGATSGTDAGQFRADGHWLHGPSRWHLDTPEAILESEQLGQVVANTLSLLPPLQHALINLRDMQGLEMEEICKILEISESNARVLLHRARNRLRSALDKYQGNVQPC